ncbi:hypothetical protein KIPB_014040, partial [Kipferlia bialata]
AVGAHEEKHYAEAATLYTTALKTMNTLLSRSPCDKETVEAQQWAKSYYMKLSQKLLQLRSLGIPIEVPPTHPSIAPPSPSGWETTSTPVAVASVSPYGPPSVTPTSTAATTSVYSVPPPVGSAPPMGPVDPGYSAAAAAYLSGSPPLSGTGTWGVGSVSQVYPAGAQSVYPGAIPAYSPYRVTQ